MKLVVMLSSGNRERSLGPRSIFPHRRPVRCTRWYSRRPEAEQLARTEPGKDDASGALTPQPSAGEGSGELHAARGGRVHVERPELPREARRKKRRKETHPAPNPRVSPVTNRKVLPQEEVIGAVESSRSREPSRERARGLESQCESEPTDSPTDRQRAREGGRRGPREEEELEEGQRGPGPPLPFALLLRSLNSPVSHLGSPVIEEGSPLFPSLFHSARAAALDASRSRSDKISCNWACSYCWPLVHADYGELAVILQGATSSMKTFLSPLFPSGTHGLGGNEVSILFPVPLPHRAQRWPPTDKSGPRAQRDLPWSLRVFSGQSPSHFIPLAAEAPL
ncbi:uncharacterized protein LOC129564022 [Moschus berezovskii]|uniref:uncharacterized protein LOC129564022 n=1 Tax=Moschus berezovskii TaxID=68408 RepID=UPI002444E785|nr:uncharacterized protein LOC129564022 [Moschus berezovskii]